MRRLRRGARPRRTHCGTVREGNDDGADAAGLECRDLREWSPEGRCAAVQVHRTASHERSPALRGDAAEEGVQEKQRLPGSLLGYVAVFMTGSIRGARSLPESVRHEEAAPLREFPSPPAPFPAPPPGRARQGGRREPISTRGGNAVPRGTSGRFAAGRPASTVPRRSFPWVRRPRGDRRPAPRARTLRTG